MWVSTWIGYPTQRCHRNAVVVMYPIQMRAFLCHCNPSSIGSASALVAKLATPSNQAKGSSFPRLGQTRFASNWSCRSRRMSLRYGPADDCGPESLRIGRLFGLSGCRDLSASPGPPFPNWSFCRIEHHFPEAFVPRPVYPTLGNNSTCDSFDHLPPLAAHLDLMFEARYLALEMRVIS